MTSTPAPERVHPILGDTRALGAALDRVLVQNPVFPTTEDKQAVLVDLARERARLEALELKVLAAADRDASARRPGPRRRARGWRTPPCPTGPTPLRR